LGLIGDNGPVKTATDWRTAVKSKRRKQAERHGHSIAARADPQVEAECAALFRPTLAETRPICGCPAIVSG
jgi:hypothetical protein